MSPRSVCIFSRANWDDAASSDGVKDGYCNWWHFYTWIHFHTNLHYILVYEFFYTNLPHKSALYFSLCWWDVIVGGWWSIFHVVMFRGGREKEKWLIICDTTHCGTVALCDTLWRCVTLWQRVLLWHCVTPCDTVWHCDTVTLFNTVTMCDIVTLCDTVWHSVTLCDTCDTVTLYDTVWHCDTVWHYTLMMSRRLLPVHCSVL